jgi:hypothetical protein
MPPANTTRLRSPNCKVTIIMSSQAYRGHNRTALEVVSLHTNLVVLLAISQLNALEPRLYEESSEDEQHENRPHSWSSSPLFSETDGHGFDEGFDDGFDDDMADDDGRLFTVRWRQGPGEEMELSESEDQEDISPIQGDKDGLLTGNEDMNDGFMDGQYDTEVFCLNWTNVTGTASKCGGLRSTTGA